jgi:hypothetical protein
MTFYRSGSDDEWAIRPIALILPILPDHADPAGSQTAIFYRGATHWRVVGMTAEYGSSCPHLKSHQIQSCPN